MRKIALLVLAVSACSSSAADVTPSVDSYVPTPAATSLIVGDKGPAGGTIVLAAMTSFPCGNNMKSWCNYLEVSPQDAETQLPWAETSFVAQEVPGANGSAIGTGWQNTMDIIAQGNSDPTKSAPAYAEAYEFGGMTDWFLPSKDELYEVYEQRIVIAASAGINYWSSSDFDLNTSWATAFSTGYQTRGMKFTVWGSLPIRAF